MFAIRRIIFIPATGNIDSKICEDAIRDAVCDFKTLMTFEDSNRADLQLYYDEAIEDASIAELVD